MELNSPPRPDIAATAAAAAGVAPSPAPLKSSTNVQVVVRCRPSSQDERARGVPEIVQVDTLSDEVRVTAPIKAGEKLFAYDRVFGPQSTQLDVYEQSVEPLVQQTLRGFNTTVLAYGQTGTGKTHTMEGAVDDAVEMGIIPRAMQSIFRSLDTKNDSESYVKASYLEIYNENLTDLLSSVPNPDALPPHQQLRLVDDKRSTVAGRGGGVIVHNLEEVLVKSYEDVRRVMKFAMSKRKVASTDLNERSSRSHAVFTVTVHSKELSPEGEELLRVGKLNLVDLAGSECVARSGSKDLRAREAGNINQSLLTLGRVITALVEKSPHISYRDSKLTRVLQESLGGCSLTLMIATVAPSVLCLDETLSTLEYASRAKAIKNKPVANQRMTKRAAIREYVEEIDRLRQELQSARAKDGVYLSEEQYNAMQLASRSTSQRVLDVEQLAEKRNQELKEMRTAHATARAELSRTQLELDAERDRLRTMRDELRRKQQELVEERLVGEEKQAVVDAHVAVEHKLHSIHDELQDRLRVAKDRISGLHDKLDRKTQTDVENDRAISKLRAEVAAGLAQVSALVREGKSACVQSAGRVDDLVQRVGGVLSNELVPCGGKQRAALVETGTEALRTAQEAHGQHTELDCQRVEREGKTTTTSLGDAALLFHAGAKLHRETVELCTAAHAAEVDMLRKSCIEPLAVELDQGRRSELAWVDSLDQALRTLHSATTELTEEYDTRLGALHRDVAELVAGEKARARRASDKAAAKVALVLASLQDDCDAQLDSVVQLVSQGSTQAASVGQERATSMCASLAALQHGNAQWASQQAERVQQCVDEVRQADAFALLSSTEAKETTMESSVDTLSSLQTGQAQCTTAQQRVEAAAAGTVRQLRDRDRAAQDGFQASASTLHSLASAAEEEERGIELRAKEHVAEAAAELGALRSGVNQFGDDALGETKRTQTVLGEFALQGDRPTGKTPGKQPNVLEWTKEKPRTAPHAMIVERVRSARAAAAAGRGGGGDVVDDAGSSSGGGGGSVDGSSDVEDVSYSSRKQKKPTTTTAAAAASTLLERDANSVSSAGEQDFFRSGKAGGASAAATSRLRVRQPPHHQHSPDEQ